MFKVEIETDNAAFEGDNMGIELAKHLRDLAEQVVEFSREDFAAMEEDRGRFVVRDSNGNRVGFAKVEGVFKLDE